MSYSSSHRRRSSQSSFRPLVAFLLVASFGILFVGCGGSGTDSGSQEEEFRFTEEDLARFRDLAKQAKDEGEEANTGTGLFVPRIDEQEIAPEDLPTLDLSNVDEFNAIRSGPAAIGDDIYRVTNTFLNVRSEPRVTSKAITSLDQGDTMKLVEFVDAAWAKVVISSGDEGFVSTRYIAQLVSEEKFTEKKKDFEGLYFVDFGFLNVRKDADTQSDKLGELPGQALVRPISKDEVWARVMFEGKEGYVAVQYLTPFLPNFLVRQDVYNLPVLHYRLDQSGVLDPISSHIARLKENGYKILTLRNLYDTVIEQEKRDVRIDPRSVVFVVSGANAENVGPVSDTLRSNGVRATFFISTANVGIDGITEKQILTLLANGFDVQSGGHTGDDLRSLTNSQLDLELAQSRQIIEQYSGKPVFAVAYPLGGVNDRVAEHAAASGYLFGVGNASERSFTRDQFLRLPSFLMNSGMTGDDVLSMVRVE